MQIWEWLNAKVNIHCERTSLAAFDEPVNIISNVSFILAAFLAWRLFVKLLRADGSISRHTPKYADIRVQILMVFLIGVGSFLFHSYATMWGALLDIFPIFCYMCLFVYSFLKRITLTSQYNMVLVFVGFVALNLGFKFVLPVAPDGNVSYLPLIIFFLGLIIYLYITNNPSLENMLYGFILALISFVFRKVDMDVCEYFPIGTHFLWHTLNGVLLYILLRELIVVEHRKHKKLQLTPNL